MLTWRVMLTPSTAVLLATGFLLLSTACGVEDPEQNQFEHIEVDDVDIPESDAGDDTGDNHVEECDIVFELPPGDSYVLNVTRFNQPAAISGLVSGYISSIPPLLLFADGLSDGQADEPVALVGGVGELVSFGFDDTPNTQEDIYALHYGSISPVTCDFLVRLDGSSHNLEMVASADVMELDLSGLSSATAGLTLQIDEVLLRGDFNADLGILSDIELSGILSDDGLDALLEAARDFLPISREQAMDLLDPDGTGIIPVELELAGRKIVVEGFTENLGDIEVEPRVEEPCCPDGLEVGDSVLPYLVWERQGLQEDQMELFFAMALPEIRDDVNVAMVTTAVRQADGEIHYHVYSGGAVEPGHIVFRRMAGDEGVAPQFEIVDGSGVNPIGNDDPTALATYESLLQIGTNPNSVAYPDQGYIFGDSRLSFIPGDEMNYPFAMERIAQNFDDPRTGDFIIIPASWATGGFGTHGHLGALQSRSPLLISGPGIRTAADGADATSTVEDFATGQTLIVEDVARQVDIAPTVAAALGVARTTGVGPDMRLRDDVYLAWQDGRVLEEIFTEEALAAIEAGEPLAERAIIIVNDGLTNVELLFQVLSDDPGFNVDNYRRIFGRGLAYRYGSISNFPSNTYPGHNTLGSGAWAGHHGIIDNSFRIREQGIDVSPIRNIFETEHMLGSAHPNLPVETLHEALVRSFGNLMDGMLAASINEPSTRGAEFATLERRLPGGFRMPSSADEVTIGTEVYPLPPADIDDYAGIMDNGSLQTLVELFQDHIHRGEDGLPIPRYTIVNFGSTDSAGHAHGPHGDHERYTVISRVNERMGILLDLLDYLEIDETTMVILTSDHGMELQDSSRSFWRSRAVAEAGVSFRQAGWFYYLKQLYASIEDLSVDDDQVTLSLRVVDHDNRHAEEPTGIEDISVRIIEGGQAEEAISDDDGYVELVITLDSGATELLVEFDGEEWNSHRERIGL